MWFLFENDICKHIIANIECEHNRSCAPRLVPRPPLATAVSPLELYAFWSGSGIEPRFLILVSHFWQSKRGMINKSFDSLPDYRQTNLIITNNYSNIVYKKIPIYFTIFHSIPFPGRISKNLNTNTNTNTRIVWKMHRPIDLKKKKRSCSALLLFHAAKLEWFI